MECTTAADCWALDTNLVCGARGRGEAGTKLEMGGKPGEEETVLEAETVEIVKQTTEGSKCECREHMKWNKE